ncbi:MAG: gluconolactonase [Gammaproteobacteria bacterium]|mgnify:CR=1 FL=1|nr:gluconolactonase [Gammaproteobacteria bacterium]
MSIEVRHPDMAQVVAEDAVRETLSEEFGFTEGPIWHPADKHVTFSDIPASKLFRWSEVDGFSVYRDPTNMANGNTYDAEGRILTCEHASSLVRREEDGQMIVLASHYEGKELNSPNDIIVRSDGAVFFTDPVYGRMEGPHGKGRELQLDFRGVYRIDADGSLILMGQDFESPNGLCFGLDESVLFVADTQRRHIRSFTIDGDTLEGGSVFSESPAPDGLKIDTAGNVYAGGPGGVHVYNPEGTFLGVIQTPAFCANFCWGGDDLCTMYMTASTGFYRISVRIPGHPLC